ncbi:MAG: phenylalanine--tRNA ligase beta subunit-related protein [Candidatus Micrarchaeota archaeon]
MRQMAFKVDEGARERLKGLNLGHMSFTGVKVQKKNPLVDQAVDSACRKVRERFADPSKISGDSVIQGIRTLFSSVGLDPTKERPSGEALMRRVVGGSGIYRVNSVVDINNVVSLQTGCPCGVYDIGKIEGETVTVSIGSPGQTYAGIGGKPMNAENRIVTIDSNSIFGGPTADSGRTCITLETSEVLMLIYHPAGTPIELLVRAMEEAKKQMERATGGKQVNSGIFSIA